MLKVEAKVELLRRELSKLEKALESFQQYRAEACGWRFGQAVLTDWILGVYRVNIEDSIDCMQ